MNSKTLLLLGVVGALAMTSAEAQVYSVNAVGYVNKTIPVGFSIIANPLTASNNTVASLFPSVPAGTVLYLFRNNAYSLTTFEEDDNGNLAWSDSSVTLLPGEGFWIKNNTAASFDVTFVGDVPTGNLSNPVPAGFSLKASQVPQAGQVDTDLGYPVALGDVIYSFKNGGYVISTREEDDNGNPSWSTPPVVGVAEGFWINSGTAKTWTRNFSVN